MSGHTALRGNGQLPGIDFLSVCAGSVASLIKKTTSRRMRTPSGRNAKNQERRSLQTSTESESKIAFGLQTSAQCQAITTPGLANRWVVDLAACPALEMPPMLRCLRHTNDSRREKPCFAKRHIDCAWKRRRARVQAKWAKTGQAVHAHNQRSLAWHRSNGTNPS